MITKRFNFISRVLLWILEPKSLKEELKRNVLEDDQVLVIHRERFDQQLIMRSETVLLNTKAAEEQKHRAMGLLNYDKYTLRLPKPAPKRIPAKMRPTTRKAKTKPLAVISTICGLSGCNNETPRSNQKFCTDNHRSKHNYQRRKAK